MEQHAIQHQQIWYPFARWGISDSYTALNADTLINTWITCGALLFITFIVRYYLAHPATVGNHLIKSTLKSLIDLIQQSTGRIIERYVYFIGSLFLFILICNWIALIPYCEEPTKDLNTTAALGIVAFLYIHSEVLRAHGLGAFLRDYFLPFNIPLPLNLIAGIVLLPFKLIGELASVVSLSFRLFGNIFGGATITSIFQGAISGSLVYHLISTLSGIALIIMGFFIIFEGFLQAFVFSILTITNIALAVQTHNEENLEI